MLGIFPRTWGTKLQKVYCIAHLCALPSDLDCVGLLKVVLSCMVATSYMFKLIKMKFKS
jgi:hypothetical protein